MIVIQKEACPMLVYFKNGDSSLENIKTKFLFPLIFIENVHRCTCCDFPKVDNTVFNMCPYILIYVFMRRK